jgi:predicted nucleic acid-binding Zn ribbon protein
MMIDLQSAGIAAGAGRAESQIVADVEMRQSVEESLEEKRQLLAQIERQRQRAHRLLLTVIGLVLLVVALVWWNLSL